MHDRRLSPLVLLGRHEVPLEVDVVAVLLTGFVFSAPELPGETGGHVGGVEG